MTKGLVIRYDRCVGCRTCEMVCSLGHEREIAPFRSRIKVFKWEVSAHSVPVNCRQCEDAPCLRVCPIGAISNDWELGRKTVDYDKCIGCRSCVLVCPFGAMAFNQERRKVAKCDLCDGDPLCARFCAYGAIEFMELDDLNSGRMAAAAADILEARKMTEAQR